jgi:hypothetical protein
MENYTIHHQAFSKREKLWALALGLLMFAVLVLAFVGS